MSPIAPNSPRLLTAAQFPTGVKDLEAPPERLFLTGQLPPGPRVAVIGTRRPTPEAYCFAQELALDLAKAGVAVVSGGAVGIDTAAHEGALRAGARTLVVAPSSYCSPYPEANRELFARIVAGGGGYLSPFNEPMKAQRHLFFARNALLVSLCVAVILVQAPYRSGARNATQWARKLGRPYWVVPHPPWCPQGGASVAELRSGGLPLAGANDVRSWLAKNRYAAVPLAGLTQGLEPCPFEDNGTPERGAVVTGLGDAAGRDTQPRVIRAARQPSTDDTQRDATGPHQDVCKLVAQLASGPRHADELCAALGWEPGRLQATLLHATLLGEVRRNDAGLLTNCSRG